MLTPEVLEAIKKRFEVDKDRGVFRHSALFIHNHAITDVPLLLATVERYRKALEAITGAGVMCINSKPGTNCASVAREALRGGVEAAAKVADKVADKCITHNPWSVAE